MWEGGWGAGEGGLAIGWLIGLVAWARRVGEAPATLLLHHRCLVTASFGNKCLLGLNLLFLIKFSIDNKL